MSTCAAVADKYIFPVSNFFVVDIFSSCTGLNLDYFRRISTVHGSVYMPVYIIGYIHATSVAYPYSFISIHRLSYSFCPSRSVNYILLLI